MYTQSPMKPKVKLNFCYDNTQTISYSPDTPTVRQHLPYPQSSSYQNMSPSGEYRGKEGVQNGCFSTRQKQLIRKGGKGVTVTTSKKPYLHQLLKNQKQVHIQTIPNHFQVQRNHSPNVSDMALKRNDFSEMRMRLTQVKPEGPKNHEERIMTVQEINQNKLWLESLKPIEVEQPKSISRNHSESKYEKQAQNVHADLYNKISAYEQQIKQNKLENKELSSKLEEEKQKLLKVKILNAEKESIYDETSRKIVQLRDQLTIKLRENDEWKQKVYKLEEVVKNNSQEQQKLKKQIEKNNQDQQMTIPKEQFLVFKSRVEQAQHFSQQVVAQLQRVSTKLSNLKVLFEKTLQETSTQIQVIDDFRIKYQELQELKQVLSQKPKQVSTEQTNTINNLRIELNKFKHQNLDLKEDNERAQSNMRILLKQIEDLRNEKNYIQKALGQMTQLYNLKQDELSQIMEEFKNSKKDQSVKTQVKTQQERKQE